VFTGKVGHCFVGETEWCKIVTFGKNNDYRCTCTVAKKSVSLTKKF